MSSVEEAENQEELDEIYLSHLYQSVEKSTDVFSLPYKDLQLNGLNKEFVKNANARMRKAIPKVTRQVDMKNTGGSKKLEPEALLGYNFLECVSPPKNLDYLSRLYDISAANHSAINAKVDNIVGLGYEWIESPQTKLLKKKVNNERRLTTLNNLLSAKKLELQEWLDNLNKIDTFEETLRKLWKDYESTGNAYLEVGRDKKGKIGYLGQVSSINVRVRANRDGFVQIIGNDAVFFRNFGDDNPNPIGDDPNPNELLHFKKYSPTSSYYGMPDILPALSALAGNEFAAKYNLDYFENKAIPRYVILAKGSRLSSNSIRQLVEFFETGLRGKHHRSVFVPVPEDATIEFEAIEANTQDSSFNDYTAANQRTIFMAHRTPMSRAGILADTGLAAARDADKIFKESVCRPEQTILEKKLNKIFFSPGFNDMFLFKFNELSLTDEVQQSEIDEKYVRMQIKVPDEIRTRMGLAPRPDGKGNLPYEPKAQEAADQAATAGKTRARDAERSANSSDKTGEGRNAKGEGRKAP